MASFVNSNMLILKINVARFKTYVKGVICILKYDVINPREFELICYIQQKGGQIRPEYNVFFAAFTYLFN
jgi:hypothetical protein